MNFQNRLVRDNSVTLLEEIGVKCVFHALEEDQMKNALLDKISKDAQTLSDVVPRPRNEHNDTVALNLVVDIIDSLLALELQMGVSPEQVEMHRLAKLEREGGFNNRVYLKRTW